MGRDAGWIALHAGIAGGAHAILIPERPESLEQITSWVRHVHERGRSSLIAIAEGFTLEGMTEAVTQQGVDGYGRPRLGGIAETLAPLIEAETGISTRATVLGHVQRGGSPTAFDRVLATRTGIAGADAAFAGDWGKIACLRGNSIEMVPIDQVAGRKKLVPDERYDEVRVTFG